MEFIESLDFEESVDQIKSQMIDYYLENNLSWNDKEKLIHYKLCDLYRISKDREDIGFIMLHDNQGDYYIAELHISKQFRNKGYGSEALGKAKSFAAYQGFSEIRIRAIKTSPAYRLYLRSGFILEKELPYTYQLVSKSS